MKKFFLYIFISIVLSGLFSPVFNVQASSTDPSEPCRFNQGDNGNNPATATNYPCEQYVLLSPFSTSLVNVDTAGPNALEKYLNLMIKIIIGLSAVLAMVMIFMGGIEYMTSEVISNKEHGKERIRNALFGLLLALGSYVLLNTINPDLLKTSLDIENVTLTVIDTANSVIVKTSGSCTPTPTGPCVPSSLYSTFGDSSTDASKICNVESGGQADRESSGDRCQNNPLLTFSYGLFQINLIAHGDKVIGTNGESCTNLFVQDNVQNTPIRRGRDYIVGNSPGPYSYSCKLNPEQGARLASCRDALKNPATNIAIATQLFRARTNPLFADWYLSDRNRCSGSVTGW